MKKILLRVINVVLIAILFCGNIFQIVRGGTWISSFTATAV